MIALNFEYFHSLYRFSALRAGRYITSDPIGLAGGINTYAYVGGNPLNWIDPNGLDRCYSKGGRLVCFPEGQMTPDESYVQANFPSANGPACPTGVASTAAEALATALFPEGRLVPVTKSITKINPKIYNQLEKQLQRDGAKSIHKALRGAEKALKSHQDKLPSLKYKSQVEGTIRNVGNQIKTLKQFIKDNNL